MDLWYRKILFFLFILILNISCSKNNSLIKTHNTLRQDIGSEVPTLDVTKAEDTSSARVSYDLFAGLVDFDQTNKVIPGMAYKWDISKDGTIYTFYLRKDLKFSDGVPITSKDFVYSFQRLVDPKTASAYGYFLSSIKNAKLIAENKVSPKTLGVLAPSLYVFVVTLERPFAAFLDSLVLANTFVVPQHIINKYQESWTNPEHMVTSGAYKLVEHVVNGYILAKKNPYYYDKDNVRIEYIKYLPFEEKNTTVTNYKSNELDISFQSLPVDQFDDLKKEFKNEVYSVSQEAIYYLDFNMQNKTFSKNLKLRQALSMAVDRETLVKQVLKQDQPALYSIVTKTIENSKYKDVEYFWSKFPRSKQVALAKQLFMEAGYSDKHPLEFTYSYNTGDLHKKIALAVSAMWKNVFKDAIIIKLNNQEWKTFIQARHKGDYEIARDGWVADYNSITSYTPLYMCDAGSNNSHYCNVNYDNLIANELETHSQQQQTILFKKALNIALNDYFVIPLFQYTYQQLVKPYVLNYSPKENHFEHVQSKWMRLDK